MECGSRCKHATFGEKRKTHSSTLVGSVRLGGFLNWSLVLSHSAHRGRFGGTQRRNTTLLIYHKSSSLSQDPHPKRSELESLSSEEKRPKHRLFERSTRSPTLT
eukprot:162226_1